MEEQDRIESLLAQAQDGDLAGALAALDALLTEVIDEPRLHALRAFLLLELGRTEEAERSADLAEQLDGDDPYVLQAVGRVAIARAEPDRALRVAAHARAQDPADEGAILLEAQACALLGRWDDVRARADYVLAGDPDNVEAAFLRVAAIEMRDRHDPRLDAGEWEALAARFPHLPVARAGRAWTLLHRGRGRAAEEEFRDALTLDPGNAWAREGLVVALKTRTPGYAALLRFFLWLQSLPPGTQTAVLIGGVIGSRLLDGIADANPALAPVIRPIIYLYVLFVLLTWLADPILNLVLMAKPEGRRLLSADDRAGALAVGGALAAGLALAAAGWLLDAPAVRVAGFAVGFTSLTVSAGFQCAPGRYRTRFLVAAVTFAALAVGSLAMPAGLAGFAFLVAIFGVVLSTWLSRPFIRKSHGRT